MLLQNLKPLPINPDYLSGGSEVFAYGYPSGGETLSLTKGNVSRIEFRNVAFSGCKSVVVQTSAPINPGNSGGPVTHKKTIDGNVIEECVGIVSSGVTGLSNVGFYIPSEYVVHVLKDYCKYAKLSAKNYFPYVTVPDVSFGYQELKNPGMRTYLGLSNKENNPKGIYITQVPETSCAYGLLEEGDVITQVDGHDVHSDGTVLIQGIEHPINFKFLIQRKHYLESLPVRIMRKIQTDKDETIESIDLQLQLNQQLGNPLFGIRDGKPLQYYIQPAGSNGAFVFIVYDNNYKSSFIREYASGGSVIVDKSACPPMVNSFDLLTPNKDLRQIIILHMVLQSDETDGHGPLEAKMNQGCQGDRVIEVNGKPITSLNDLVISFEENAGKLSIVKLANGSLLFVEPSNKDTASQLQEKYKIPFFSSSRILTQEKIKKSHKAMIKELNELGESDNNVHLPSSIKK